MTRPHNRLLRWLLDALLIPVAVVLILAEDVLWAGALALLGRFRRLALVQTVQNGMARLPAFIVLPLFLVPEVFSHLAGFYVTLLLAQGHVVAATGMMAVKLLCTLLLVWIYTTCQNTLLAVPWFARFHHLTTAMLAWAKAQVAPMRARARALLARLKFRSAVAGLRLRSRLRAARIWLARRWQTRRG